MPRAVKTKAGAAVGASPAKKPKTAPKKKKLYDMPEHLNPGTVVTDLNKVNWKVGETIGMGGFGEIYLACREGEKVFNYVLKCEPFENGPLFVEMHFYLRNVRPNIIEAFKKEHGLKSLGMPHLLGNGSAEINGKKHRFIVMPRYGSNLQILRDQNNGQIPEATILRLTLQMLDVLEFIHSIGYVHADLKATNIVLGYGKGGASQAYLVDFGLASRINSGEYKPDARKMHNGTIEYTARDSHLGVATKRADLEILAYNLIDWFGGNLPWVKENLLAVPLKVQAAKEKFMKDVSKNLQTIFANEVPSTLKLFLSYVANLKHDENPDYNKCRKIFADALKAMKVSNVGDLEFTKKKVIKTINEKPKAVKVETQSSDEEISESDPDTSTRKPLGRVGKTPVKSPKARVLQTVPKPKEKKSPVKISNGSAASPMVSASPRRHEKRTPLAAKTNINIKPSFSITTNSSTPTPKRAGNTIINDTLTPPVTNRGNTYEFNFELDVSTDANVVVNVKRKKKDVIAKKSTATTVSQSSEEQEESPRTRAKLRKIASEKSDSIIVPATKVIKTKRK